MRRVTGLPDDQVTAWEAKLEQRVVDSLQSVMDKIAARIERIQVASIGVDRHRVLVAVATTGPTGDDDPPPMTGELAIPEPVPLPEVLPPDAGLPPGQPYISPDDLASIAPMWQQAVAEQVLPLAAQVFIDSMGHVRSQFLDAVGPGVTLGLPGLGSVAAEEYLARARNTFDEIGDHLWATARAQLSEGFDAGESIPQLGARLRQSAGLSARTAVMVARTQVIEASNAGSIAMARASRLEMEKEWIATADLRTRPTHLAADGQRVALSAKFLVGGFSADFPADPSLPYSERLGCRCTQGYVMPERQPALPSQDLAQLPGTTSPRAAEIEAPPEPALGEVLAKEPGEPGFDLDDFPEPPPIKVRSALLRARTDRDLIAAWQGEMRAITGRDIIVQLPPDSSVLTMREHAEGVLQMLERFPEARLRKISWYDTASTEYAHVRAGSGTLEFNAKWASTAHRREYLASLRHDVSGWDDASGPGYGWSVRGAKNPQATSWHEMAHILSIETLGGRLKAEAMRITLRRMADAGTLDMGDYVSRQISAYAASKKGNLEEMIAEAMTDVVANGPRASLLSRELYDMVAREYRAKGFAVRTTTAGDAFEDFTRIPDGEVFPKAPAPKQPRVTVAAGRDLTGDHDLAVRAEREAGRERELPTDTMGRVRLPEGYQGDYAFQELAKAQGFNGLPRIVADDRQWQTLLDADYVPLYRGHGWAGGDGVGQVDAFNYGERYVGGGFAPGNNMSTRYETALHYADGHSAAVGHYALPTNARVISYPDLVAERDAYIARLPAGEAGDVERSLYLTADENLGLGRFGVARGYDAMVVPRGEQLLTDRVEEWVIFNRSKLVAYDDSAKGVASASGKVTPTKMSAPERVRREKDAAVVSARQVGHLTRELDQMISEGGEEAFRSGALFRRIKAKGSELDTPPAVMREFIAASRPSEKGSSLAALRAAMERANAEAGVTRIGTPGEVWRFSGRRDDPTGAVRDIAEGTPVVVVRPGSLIEYKGKPLQIAPPRVRPATPEEIAAAERAPTPAATAAPSASRLATMKIGDLRALAKERGITVPAGTRKADLVRMLDEGATPTPAVAGPASGAVGRLPSGFGEYTIHQLRVFGRERGIPDAAKMTERQLVRALDEAAPPPGATAFEARMARATQGPQGVASAAPLDFARAEEFKRVTDPLAVGLERTPFEAIQWYRGIEFHRLNDALRAAEVPAEVASNPWLRALDIAMDASPLRAETLTFRGLSQRGFLREVGGKLDLDGDLTGATWTGRTYISTSSDPSIAYIYGGRPDAPGVFMRVVSPEGTRGVAISGGEAELTLARGQQFRVVKDHGVQSTPGGPRRVLDVEVVPSGPPLVAPPVPVVPSAALPARVVAARAELERVRALPVDEGKSRRMGGQSAYTTQVEHVGGPPTIVKDYGRADTKVQGVRNADAEELGSLVDDAIELRPAAVVRTGPRSIEQELLTGQNGADILPFPHIITDDWTDSDNGRLMGLADLLMGDGDRNAENLIRRLDGHLSPIDRGGAFRTQKLAGADGPFGDALIGRPRRVVLGLERIGDTKWPKAIDMASADLALIRQRLEALRPEFERLKRGTWWNQMMARLAEVEKRATGTRTRLAEAVESVVSPEARAVARQATIDERRAVADSLGEVRELLANGASERALASRARLIAGRTSGVAQEDLAGLVKAMESGDADRIRVALGDVAQRRGLTEVGGGGSDVVAFDPKIHEVVGGARRPPVGTFVQVQRPGYSVRLDDGEVVQLSKAKVDTLTAEEIAERTAAQERKALRDAARERNRVVESQRATAKLLAEVDELAAKGATKTAIRERLDPALREAGQAYAGADAAVVDTLSAALDSGDMAKIRAAVTRASTKAKIKPIGRAGAKTTFDPDTMEGVGGIDIAPGAKVTVVRRGSTLPGIETPEKAQVVPVRAASTAKTVAKGDFTGLTRVGEQMGSNPGGLFEAGDGSRWYIKAATNPAQLRSEKLALDLYREAGLDVPDAVVGQGAEGLGSTQIASRFLDDATSDLRTRLADEAYRRQLQEGFAVDAWLGNWDVLGLGLDNVLTTAAGTPIRIEAGGALRFRAQGAAKAFGDEVGEFDTMREAGRGAGRAFADMTPEQLIVSAERVRKITPAKIKALVKKHGLDSELADTLIARRADLLRRAEALAGPRPLTPQQYADRLKVAAKGQDALDAVPGNGASRGNLQSEALDRYRVAPILNEVLRGQRLERKHLTADIREIDQVFDGSRLTDDVELWRSPGSGRGIFGGDTPRRPGELPKWGDDLAGFEWVDAAYSSASASQRVADKFVKDGGVRLRIIAPRGSKAIRLSGMPGGGYISPESEAEILLGRGARFRVVRDRGWTEAVHPTAHKKIRVRDLDVEVVVPNETPPLPWATK